MPTPPLSIVPIKNAPWKGGNQADGVLSASHCLNVREDQREVARDALLLELAGRQNPFPRRRNLDENSASIDTSFLVKLDQAPASGDASLRIERKAGVDFGRHIAGNELGYSHTQIDSQGIDRQRDHFVLTQVILLLCILHRLVHQREVIWIARQSGLSDEKGVRRRVGD